MASEIAVAYVTLLPSARGFAPALQSQIGGPMNALAASQGSKFGATFTKVAGPLIGLATAAKAVDFLKDSVGEAREANRVAAQTEAVLKSTGGAANLTGAQFAKLAESISAKTGIDDEQIQSMQNVLAIYTNVRDEAGKGNQVFSSATRIITDMSVALGTDMTSAAKLVGRALNDPVKGMGALKRVLGELPEAQQKVIKGFVDSGRPMLAQKILLQELDKKFGGSAAAQATATDKMKVAWGNLQEKIGQAFIPVIERSATFIADRVIPGLLRFGEVVGQVFGDLSAAFKADGFSGAIDLIVTKFEEAWPRIKVWLTDTLEGLTRWANETLVPAIKEWTPKVLDAFMKWVTDVQPRITAKLAELALMLAKWALTDLVPLLIRLNVEITQAALGWVADAVRKIPAKLGEFADSVILWFGRLPKKITDAVGNLGKLLFNTGKDIVQGLIDGIKSMAGKLVKAITENVVNLIPAPIRDILELASPSKVMFDIGLNVVDGLILGLRSRQRDLGAVMGEIAATVNAADEFTVNDMSDPNRGRPGFVQAEDGSWVPTSFYGGPAAAPAAPALAAGSGNWGDIIINGSLGPMQTASEVLRQQRKRAYLAGVSG